MNIELLSPARNLICGIEAIKCGADAVYIGAPQFGARVAAGNSVEDIALLVRYAHLFGAKVYVTLNTILYDDELDAARRLAMQLYEVGVDALITQDMAYVEMQLPIALNASTQMDNRSVGKVRFLSELGFRRVILARELGLTDIRAIHQACPDVELEAFVHGALCVSYSGQCYASQFCFQRSANRGACAQFCRLSFNLEDGEGKVLLRDKHLLSLKDMNRSASIEEMIDAGVCSFKIEGRLKDVTYVKNVTAYYRRAIDAVLRRRPDLHRASWGTSHIAFEPQLDKSFSRGFTEYFLHGRTEDVASVDTPKSVGEPVGHVKSIRRREVKVAGVSSFHNGDGLCFFDEKGKLCGFRVNKVENNVLILVEPCAQLKERMALYRNYDAAFTAAVERPSSDRTLALDIELREMPDGFLLTLTDETGTLASLPISEEKLLARTPQRERIAAELSKLGGTVFTLRNVTVDFSEEYFIPAARVASWRRVALDKLVNQHRIEALQRRVAPVGAKGGAVCPVRRLDFTGNVSNCRSRAFYRSLGVADIKPAFELQPVSPAVVMTCRHCIRYMLGGCVRRGGKPLAVTEPLYLRLPDGRRFRLAFDCTHCEMKVLAE